MMGIRSDRAVWAIGLAALVGLAGCGDPVAQLDRLSDVELAEAEATRLAAGPGEAEADPPVLPALLDEARSATEVEAGREATETTAASAAPRAQGGGLLSLFAPPGTAEARVSAQPQPDGPDAAVIAPGQTLPFGEIATVCGLSEATMGAAVAQGAGLALRDSNPSSTQPRAHYLTGFDDGCARQFTAALAMLGDAATHEMVRYEPSNARIAYSETDLAYEEIKARVCRVAGGQPCGARIDELSRRTLFVTVYERFGGTPVWAEILIHDGAVIAKAFKSI